MEILTFEGGFELHRQNFRRSPGNRKSQPGVTGVRSCLVVPPEPIEQAGEIVPGEMRGFVADFKDGFPG
jgi:hypothetical protein